MSDRCRLCAKPRLVSGEDPAGKCEREYSTGCMVTVLAAARVATSNAEHDTEQWITVAEERGVALIENERHRRALANALRACAGQLEAEFARGGAIYGTSAPPSASAALAARNAIRAAVAALDEHG